MTDIPGLVNAVTSTAITVSAFGVVNKTVQKGLGTTSKKSFKSKSYSKKKKGSFW